MPSDDGQVGTIYLLHFSGPLGDPERPHMSARHYLGWTNGVLVSERLREHREGRGAKITAAAVARGITLDVVRTFPGTRNDERRIKKGGHFSRMCPECKKRRKR